MRPPLNHECGRVGLLLPSVFGLRKPRYARVGVSLSSMADHVHFRFGSKTKLSHDFRGRRAKYSSVEGYGVVRSRVRFARGLLLGTRTSLQLFFTSLYLTEHAIGLFWKFVPCPFSEIRDLVA